MIDYKKIYFGYLLVVLISIPLHSQDDECDILCRAGVQSQDIPKSKPKPKPEIKNNTYSNQRSYSSYNQSNLFIKNTESTKKDIAKDLSVKTGYSNIYSKKIINALPNI